MLLESDQSQEVSSDLEPRTISNKSLLPLIGQATKEKPYGLWFTSATFGFRPQPIHA
jgi:hypothetical protein